MLDILLADRWSHYCKCFRTFLPRVCISNNMHCSIHLISTGVFAARKGAYFAYLEITSQQRAFFRPGECRGEHQGTTGRTLVRNLSSARRTRSPPVL